MRPMVRRVDPLPAHPANLQNTNIPTTTQALVAARAAHPGVRNVAGILITTLATHTLRTGLQLGQAWPELFPALLEMLGSGQRAVRLRPALSTRV